MATAQLADITDGRIPRHRITGTTRLKLARALGQRYKAGEAIRPLAAEAGISFGLARNLILDQGVKLRPRGGATRGPRKATR